MQRNPFIGEELKVKRRYIAERINNKAGIDVETGEIEDMSILSAQEQLDVDIDTFVKIYQPCVDSMADMPIPAFAVFRYILNFVKYSDIIALDINKICKFTKYKNKSSIYSGIRWLIDNKFIAKKNEDVYWINFHYFYRGNRLKIK